MIELDVRERTESRVARLREDAARLPGPRSRLHHPAAMAAAEAFVLDAWTEAGWDCERRPFRFDRHSGLRDHGDFRPHEYRGLQGANLVARKPGRSPATVVVGAHLDTVRDSPGADDNGSGVVALLELARILAPLPLRRSVELVAFDMEEIGLAGSRAYVEAALGAGQTVIAALILECVGFATETPGSQTIPRGFHALFPRNTARVLASRRRADWTAVIHRSDARWLADVVVAALQQSTPGGALRLRDPLDLRGVGALLGRAVPSLANLARSDHLPFWTHGIPAVQLTNTAHFRNPNYHQPSDLPEMLDLAYLAGVVEATMAGVVVSAAMGEVLE